MNIICVILDVVHHLVKQVTSWVKQTKISKKSRREKAVFVVCGTAVAAIAFSSHSVHAQEKTRQMQ